MCEAMEVRDAHTQGFDTVSWEACVRFTSGAKMFPTLSKVQRFVSIAKILSTFLKSCMDLIEYQVETNLRNASLFIAQFLS